MDFEEVFGMSLYDNDSYREEFMEEVYKLLADDPDTVSYTHLTLPTNREV